MSAAPHCTLTLTLKGASITFPHPCEVPCEVLSMPSFSGVHR